MITYCFAEFAGSAIAAAGKRTHVERRAATRTATDIAKDLVPESAMLAIGEMWQRLERRWRDRDPLIRSKLTDRCRPRWSAFHRHRSDPLCLHTIKYSLKSARFGRVVK